MAKEFVGWRYRKKRSKAGFACTVYHNWLCKRHMLIVAEIGLVLPDPYLVRLPGKLHRKMLASED